MQTQGYWTRNLAPAGPFVHTKLAPAAAHGIREIDCRARLETVTRQANTAGLLQHCQALLELQVAQASKALLGSGLPAAQVYCAILKAICTPCRANTELNLHK